MSYTRPLGSAANFAGKPPYTRPLGNAANFQSVDEAVLLILADVSVEVLAAAELAVDRTSLYGAVAIGVQAQAELEFARVRVGTLITNAWATAKVAAATVSAVSPDTAVRDIGKHSPWREGRPIMSERGARWRLGAIADRGEHAPWGRYERHIDERATGKWGRSRIADDAAASPWGRYERRINPAKLAPWGKAIAKDRRLLAPWGRLRALDLQPMHAVFAKSARRDLLQWVPWTRYSRILQPGWGAVTPPGPTPDPNGTWIVPIKQVYIVLNESTLVRVSDNAVIPTLKLSLNLEANSWAWGWTATVPYSALPLIERGTEVQAAVNGVVVRLMVESLTRSRTFGKDTLSLKGRGRNALLDVDRLNFGNLAASRTAQQLAYDALLDNGVPLEWAIDWGLTDWLVPAGAWTLKGSRIDAIKAIAEAAGGYVQPHNTDQVLRVLHRYPTAPWDWAGVTPDYELPTAVVTQEGIEWVSKPAYNRVFVAGTGQGVTGQITRAGTAGDLVAEMVTDALTTHIDAASQRGRAVLSDTGDQALVTLRLPVLEETGLIVPGKFVRYVDGSVLRIGLVRSISVDVGTPEAWQTIEVETHE
jgi:hypothetical protein